MTSLLPTPEPPDPVEGALGHFDHSNWVKASLKALDEGTVHSNGGVATGTLLADQVTIDNPEDQTARLNLKGNITKSVLGKTSGDLSRWELVLGDNTTEGGNNAGSLFKLLAYSDAGSLLQTVLKADRSSGLLEVVGSPTAAKGVATKEYVDNSMPVGTILMYGGTSLPAEMLPYWQICNGSAHSMGAGSKIQAVLGSANVPDLSGKFIVATGGGYNPKDMGGAASVTLTAAQSGSPSHTHGTGVGTSTASTGHDHGGSSHSMNQNPNHGHVTNIPLSTSDQGFFVQSGGAMNVASANYGLYQASDERNIDHVHGINADAGSHAHTFTPQASSAMDAMTAHENRPPYYALIYIIKKA